MDKLPPELLISILHYATHQSTCQTKPQLPATYTYTDPHTNLQTTRPAILVLGSVCTSFHLTASMLSVWQDSEYYRQCVPDLDCTAFALFTANRLRLNQMRRVSVRVDVQRVIGRCMDPLFHSDLGLQVTPVGLDVLLEWLEEKRARRCLLSWSELHVYLGPGVRGHSQFGRFTVRLDASAQASNVSVMYEP